MMAHVRNNFIPVIYVKGTHYEVGFNVGSTFRSIIQEYVKNATDLHNHLIPFYETEGGRQYFQNNLSIIEKVCPDYVQELRGIAKGSDVPFHNLLLMHLDIAYSSDPKKTESTFKEGCSTILCNQPGHVIIGHNEDALPNALNYCYIVNAEIVKKSKDGHYNTVEKYSALCYAGELPGFCMGFNCHGLVFTINLILPEKNPSLSLTFPRHFLCRKLLSAHTVEEAIEILSAKGCGLNDGFSVNLAFYESEKQITMHSIELGPGISYKESAMDCLKINEAETYFHCNRYKRLNISLRNEFCMTSSVIRENTFESLPLPVDDASIRLILGDRSHSEYCIFREGKDPDFCTTIATGIFNLVEKTWSIYIENPENTNNLLCTLPMTFQK